MPDFHTIASRAQFYPRNHKLTAIGYPAAEKLF